MSHPYAGAFGLGIAGGMATSLGTNKPKVGMPGMKGQGSRPSSNFGPNVTLMAHRGNRGM